MISTDRANIDKIAATADDRLLLAKLWDKINAGMRRNVPAFTHFLSPREQEMARFLFGDTAGLYTFGGFADAERKMLCYLPDYLDEDFLYGDSSPIVCLRATFYEGDTLSHRDFLGGLLGCGLERQVLGDILVSKGCCDFFVAAHIADFIQQNFTSAGRTKLHLTAVPLTDVRSVDTEFV